MGGELQRAHAGVAHLADRLLVARRLNDLGFVIAATTPAEFGASMDAAEARFTEVIAAAGIRPEDA